MLDHGQQDNGGAVGRVAALLPIADRVELEAESRGEVCLGKSEVLPDGPYIHAWRRRNPVRLDAERKQRFETILVDGPGIEFSRHFLALGQSIEHEMSLAQRQAKALERTSDIDRLADISVSQQHLNRWEI